MKRHVWRPLVTQNRASWWFTRRLVPVGLFAATAGLLLWLLLEPFFHPRTYLLFRAAADPVGGIPHVPAGADDLASIHLPKFELLADGQAPGAASAGRLASPATLDAALKELDREEITGRDVLLVWIRAQAVAAASPVTLSGQESAGPEVELLCDDFDRWDGRTGRYPLSRLLQRVQTCPAGTKVIFLDIGWTAHAPRIGIFADGTPQQVRELVERIGDPTLWVMVSHSALEVSHHSQDARQSAFASFVGEGLQGAADGNEDRLIDLGELWQFVSQHLADREDRPADQPYVQSPMLVHGAGQGRTALPGRRDGPEGPSYERRDVPYPVLAPVTLVPLVEVPTLPTKTPAAVPNIAELSKKLPPQAGQKLAAATGKVSKQPSPDPVPADQQTSGRTATASVPELQTLARSLCASLDASPLLRPQDNAPHLWRAVQARLNDLQAALESLESPGDSAEAAELRQLVQQLEDLAAGRLPLRFQRQDLVADLAFWLQLDVPAESAHSLAMADQLARLQGRALPEDLAAIVTRLDRIVATGTFAEYQSWVTELPAKFDVYVECRLARRLSACQELSWPSVQLALRACRLGEQAAAVALASGPWTRAIVDAGDRLRRDGERRLTTRIHVTDEAEATSLLRRSSAEYERALAAGREVVATQRVVNQAMFRLPELFHRAIIALAENDAAASDPGAVAELLPAVALTLDLLDRPSIAGLADLRRGRSQTGIALEKVGAATEANKKRPAPSAKAADRGQLTPEERLGRLKDWADLYGRAIQILARDPSGDRQLDAVVAASLQLRSTQQDADDLWNACGRFGKELETFYLQLPAKIELLCGQNEDLTKPDERAAKIEKLRLAQRWLYLVHPWDAARIDRPGPVRMLRQAELYDLLVWQQQRLKGALRDAAASEAKLLGDAAAAYGRAADGMARQPPVAPLLRSPIEISGPTQLDLIDTAERELVLRVTNRDSGSIAVWMVADYDPALLELSTGLQSGLYDSAGFSVSAIESVAAGSPTPAAGSPQVRTGDARAGLAPTYQLRPGESQTLRIRVRRTSFSAAGARIAIRAVTATSVVRHDLAAELPRNPGVDLVVDGLAETWQATADGLTLYPFPNKTTSYQLYLANSGTQERVVDFSLLQAPKAAILSPPPGEVAASVASEYLARVEAANPVTSAVGLTVPAGGKRVPVPILAASGGQATPPAPQPLKPAESAPPASTPAESTPPTNGGSAAQPSAARHDSSAPSSTRFALLPAWHRSVSRTSRQEFPYPHPSAASGQRWVVFQPAAWIASALVADEPPPAAGVPAVSDGTNPGESARSAPGQPEAPTLPDILLAVITDRSTQRCTVKRIKILTQRPARYLEPRLEYDPQAGRVEITVRATAPLPAAGVAIACESLPAGAGQRRSRAAATLRPPASEAQLRLEVPPDAGTRWAVLVHADGFERAFRFDVPLDAPARLTVPESRTADVQILEPPAGRAFGPEPAEINVALAADLPPGALDAGNCSVEVGVDADRDRTLRNEPSIRLTSDRQVDLFLDPAPAGGGLAIRTRVRHLRVVLTAPGILAGRANLLARIMLPDEVIWSEPVPIVFDNEPPVLSRLQLEPGSAIAQGGNLAVSVVATDDELSGVAKVEAAFDVDLQGKFGPGAPPVAGSLQPDGRWLINLPTAPVNPGAYHLLVRATDRVGNTSDYLKSRVDVVPKDAADAKTPMPIRISGRAVFGKLGKSPAAGVTVRLVAGGKTAHEIKSDQDGQFAFEQVAPGEYKLVGEGLIAGNQRKAEIALTVSPGPQKAEPVELILETPR